MCIVRVLAVQRKVYCVTQWRERTHVVVKCILQVQLNMLCDFVGIYVILSNRHLRIGGAAMDCEGGFCGKWHLLLYIYIYLLIVFFKTTTFIAFFIRRILLKTVLFPIHRTPIHCTLLPYEWQISYFGCRTGCRSRVNECRLETLKYCLPSALDTPLQLHFAHTMYL